MAKTTDTLIVGGGVCGAYLARLLSQRGGSYLLAEAGEGLGGRARTARVAGGSSYVDLGPAWVWPHQRRVLALLDELGVPVFEQFSEGNLVYQDPRAPGVRELEMATMKGALRLEGGMSELVSRMAGELDAGSTWLGAKLTRLSRRRGGVRATFLDGREVDAREVVLAMPPRIAAATLAYEPELPLALARAMEAVPTWMAGHAKAVAVYPEPFWRARGLSGDGISHRGPLGEIHDASPRDLSVGALFGFFAAPAPWRRAHADRIDEMVRGQLAAMFGAEAGDPRELLVLDWADEALVATAADAAPPREHPHYRPLPAARGEWEGALWLSGTEVAPSEGGFIEGALVAARAALGALGS